jgi:hypothetical protein
VCSFLANEVNKKKIEPLIIYHLRLFSVDSAKYIFLLRKLTLINHHEFIKDVFYNFYRCYVVSFDTNSHSDHFVHGVLVTAYNFV